MTIIPAYLKSEQEYADQFSKYWSDRGINVNTDIQTVFLGDGNTYCLRSNLVMRVPRKNHENIHGHKVDIKDKKDRKWY